mgnify:CR=1 FL=1
MNPPRVLLQPLAPASTDDENDAVARLTAAVAEGGADALPPSARAGDLRLRLLDRVSRSAGASRAFVTVRRRGARNAGDAVRSGVAVTVLYQATGTRLRAGEPWRTALVELTPGTRWQAPAPRDADHSEWLVVNGSVQLAPDGGDPDPAAPHLRERDYYRRPAGTGAPIFVSADGATLYLREAPGPQGGADRTLIQRDAEADWHDYAPGIRRRVLWSHAGEASMLYDARPGAQVPQHAHGHDEECLMVDGEAFLDDVLLRRLDYQLAPAGTMHQGVSTDSGGVIFAHGDLDLDLRPD